MLSGYIAFAALLTTVVVCATVSIIITLHRDGKQARAVQAQQTQTPPPAQPVGVEAVKDTNITYTQGV